MMGLAGSSTRATEHFAGTCESEPPQWGKKRIGMGAMFVQRTLYLFGLSSVYERGLEGEVNSPGSYTEASQASSSYSSGDIRRVRIKMSEKQGQKHLP